MAVDPRFGNSSGYFKDPVTGEDLSPDTPRVVPCSFENGKFTWPCVAQSDGEAILKIVYKYFTEEEKELYKQYRGRDGSGHSQVSRPKKQKSEPQTQESSYTEPEPEPVVVVKHDTESIASDEAIRIVSQCDKLYGISQIAGLTYALVGKSGSSTVHCIPRAVIPDELLEGLNAQ